MKAHYRSGNGRLTIELEAGSVKDLFAAVAQVSEVFDADSVCGCCESPRIIYRVRDVEGNRFFELYCTEPDCGAVLEFGQHRQGGTLFPKRKNDQGLKLASRGWAKFTAAGSAKAS
jgi:hypothetical protein